MRIDMGKPKIDYAKLPAIHRKLLEQEIVSVDAGWRVFQINLAKHLYEGLDKCHGVTDFDGATITLDMDVSDDLAYETLVHELTHVILETVGCGDNYGEQKDLVITNEKLTTLTSRGLIMFMTLNPKLFQLLLDGPL